MKLALALPRVILGATVAAGCAGVDDKAPARAKPEYITGSHIPVKDAPPPLTDAEREQTIEKVRKMQRTDSSERKTGSPQ